MLFNYSLNEKLDKPSLRVDHQKTVERYIRRSFPEPFNHSGEPEFGVCDPLSCTDINTTLRFDIQRGDYYKTLMQTKLAESWLRVNRTVDLYVRAGCRGADELFYLFASMEYFWPLNIGEVIVVLDYNDFENEHLLIPNNGFKYHVVYEHATCFKGPIMNQISYLYAWRYTNSEYLVTIDSDCVFYAPVIPETLFDENGNVYIPTSTTFQHDRWGYPWSKAQYFFTKQNDTDIGHPMVTQPVTFKATTIKKFLYEWIPQTNNGSEWESLLLRFTREYMPQHRLTGLAWMCWMCQITPYIWHLEEPGYNIKIHPYIPTTDLYMKLALHVPYEYQLIKTHNYHDAALWSVSRGLECWLNNQCDKALLKRMFSYGRSDPLRDEKLRLAKVEKIQTAFNIHP